MKKIIIKKVFQKISLLSFIERLNFWRQKIKNKKSNRLFSNKNKGITLPPDYYMYETFNLNYDKFYFGGMDAAKWLHDHLEKFITFNEISVLDWGCGPGRIIRHLPLIMGNQNSYFGCDYNEKYVKWCSENIANVIFKTNELSPPLDFKDNSFNIVYGISIFTHLTEEMHHYWMNELTRVLKNNGVLFLTTHGQCYRDKLLDKEKKLFDSGKLVAHEFEKEGNRLFASYQPLEFFKKLITHNNLVLLKHIPGEIVKNRPQQDVWILLKT